MVGILQSEFSGGSETVKANGKPDSQRGKALPKCPTGIAGFDEITLGGAAAVAARNP